MGRARGDAFARSLVRLGCRWVGVYECGRQLRDGMGQRVLGFMRDAVGIGKAGCGVNVEFGVGV